MKSIENFLKDFCIKVRKNETLSYVELMMDNHKCIEYNGKQYYIPECGFSNDEDDIIYNFLIDNYIL